MLVDLGCKILVLVTMFSRWSNSHHNKEKDSLQQESKVIKLDQLVSYVIYGKTFVLPTQNFFLPSL